MELWQREHILKNKVKLLENTRCNELLVNKLQAAGIFGPADVAEIEPITNRLKQANQFYEIIITRTNGYVQLIYALTECKQDASAKILLKGTPKEVFSKYQISFLGRDYYLQNLLNSEEIHELSKTLKNSLTLEEYTKMIFKRNEAEVVPLMKNTIPPPDTTYLQRHLAKRIKVNTEIFTTDCNDVFVFDGVTRAHLTTLAAAVKCYTATSTQQVVKLTSRFIVLESQSHCDSICDIAVDTPVHFITYDSDSKTYFLTKTTGGSKSINQFLNRELQDEEAIIHESDLATTAEEMGFSICDLPGMGKSLLLANMARTFAECNSETITAFIPLPTLAQNLTTNNDAHLDDFWQAILMVARTLSPEETTSQILFHLLKKRNIPMALYFDGLDEVPKAKLSPIKTFLHTLQKHKWVRIHVTSRPHMRHELEASLGIIPYDILPFSHQDKIQFLVNFWMQQDSRCDKSKLAKFANYCLKQWKEHLTHEDLKITGIPLQCRLLAEVYSRHALRYSQQSAVVFDVEITETTLTQLYNSYLKIGLSKVRRSLTSNVNHAVEKEVAAIEHFHTWKSLELLYPTIAAEYAKYYKVDTDGIDFENIMSLGFLLEVAGQGKRSLKFVHKTFADFLAARFFVTILKKKSAKAPTADKQQNFEKFILEYFFRVVANIGRREKTTIQLTERTKISIGVPKFSNNGVMKFVNDQLPDNLDLFNESIYSAFTKVVSAERCYNLLVSTLVQKLANILRLISHALSGLSILQVILYKRHFHCHYKGSWVVPRSLCLLYISAKFSNASTTRELYKILDSVFQFDLVVLHNLRPAKLRTPLHIALEHADYEIVEHVLRYSTSFKEKELLEYMVKKSYEDGSQVVQNKVAICHLLAFRNSQAVQEMNATELIRNWSPYTVLSKTRGRVLGHVKQSRGIHPELFKVLVQYGAGIKGENKYDKNIVESAALFWTADEFHQLVKFLIDEEIDIKIFVNFHTSLFEILKNSREQLHSETLKLVSDQVQWDGVDDCENTLVHAAIAGNQCLDTVMECIEGGADFRAKNKLGWSLLHVAAALRNVELINYLVDIGLSMAETSQAGDTPLHLFFLKTKKVLKLLKSVNLWDPLTNERERFKIPADLTHKIVTTYITNQSSGEIRKGVSEKNKKGQTVLHNCLYDKGKDLELRTDTFVAMVNGLEIDIYDNDKAGNSLLLAALKGKKEKSILELLT